MSFYHNNLEFVHTIHKNFSTNGWSVNKIVEEDGLLYLQIEKDVEWLKINIETEIYLTIVDVLESIREDTIKGDSLVLLQEAENEILCKFLDIGNN